MQVLLTCENVWLVCGKDPERVDDLFGCVDVGRLPGHEVEETVELNVAGSVGVNDRQDALKKTIDGYNLPIIVAKTLEVASNRAQ